MKKLIIVFLLMMPSFVFAQCSIDDMNEGKDIAEYISLETNYNKDSNDFTIILYNITKDMKVRYAKEYHKANFGKVVLNNIRPGDTASVSIYYKDCDNQVKIIKKRMPYYNKFYKSYLCNGYENIIYGCSAQFTSYNITERIIELGKENYDKNRIPNNANILEPVKNDKSFSEKVKDLANKWGIRILLLITSSLISYAVGNNLYRKELHGV